MKEIIKITIFIFLGIAGMFIILLGPVLVLAYFAHTSVYAETSTTCECYKNDVKQEYKLLLNSNVYEFSSNHLSFDDKSGIKRILNDSTDYTMESYNSSISLLDENKIYDSRLTIDELGNRMDHYCESPNRSFTCVYKEKNIMKYEFMKWWYKSYGDYGTKKLDLICSTDYKNQLAKTASERDYLFCVLDNVDAKCVKQKFYKLVD